MVSGSTTLLGGMQLSCNLLLPLLEGMSDYIAGSTIILLSRHFNTRLYSSSDDYSPMTQDYTVAIATSISNDETAYLVKTAGQQQHI